MKIKSAGSAHRYLYQKKLILRLKIIIIIIVGLSNLFAENTFSAVTKILPDLENNTDIFGDNLTAFSSESGLLQNLITGKVTDASTGEPLPGVNIVVKGTSIGTLTDSDGKYSLNFTGGDGVLVFSFIGYTVKEVPVAGKNVIDLELAPELTGLDEVVVIGYGVAKKSDLTGAIAQIKADELGNYSPSYCQ